MCTCVKAQLWTQSVRRSLGVRTGHLQLNSLSSFKFGEKTNEDGSPAVFLPTSSLVSSQSCQLHSSFHSLEASGVSGEERSCQRYTTSLGPFRCQAYQAISARPTNNRDSHQSCQTNLGETRTKTSTRFETRIEAHCLKFDTSVCESLKKIRPSSFDNFAHATTRQDDNVVAQAKYCWFSETERGEG